ncbi:SIR2 family protein [Candidatus Colwellia aromaticivorans]|uniref:SIR2 family protein n=1 Tax=Candidatus Colwellia aromaticivorans TaxID=2267621 RepID=UPI000DF26C4D|nr:SIR2 family protein [Candidatus Colwellia aromaticivorans]
MSLPNSLIEALSSKNILPLVGAGVSMSINNKDGGQVFPSWGGLLQSAADKLKAENDDINSGLIELFLQGKDYHEAAKYAHKGLDKGLWHKFITESFDPNLDDLDKTSSELPKAIWSLSNEIITLNYDKILQWAYPGESAQVSILKNTDHANLANMLNTRDKPIVWHLHGHIDDTANLILTPAGYSKLYPTSEESKVEFNAALSILKNIAVTRSLLFIGCSLDDAELLAEINKQNELFSGNTTPHFALVKKSNESAIQEKLKDTNIKTVTFDGYGDPLVAKINEMAAHIKNDAVASAVLPSIQEEIIDLQLESKIAFLSANPFGQNIDYCPIFKEIRKLPYTIDCLTLTEDNLQELSCYDYVFIATRVIKNRLLIEDDNACFDKIDFISLQNDSDLDGIKGVFIFTDNLVDESKLEGIKLPLLILPAIENPKLKKLSTFYFQIFKRNNVNYYADYGQVLNCEKFILPKIQNKQSNKIIKNETKLPKSIDKSILKHYVGRQEDLISLTRHISNLEEDNGFITIKGSGGLGKTAISKILAIKLAERGRYKGGIEFIDCEHLLNFEQFKFKISSVFNLEQAQNLEQHLTDNHDQKSRLIILDNFETLIHLEDKTNILDLLSFMSEFSSIIVTSREFLKIDGEIPYTLRQMTLDEAYDLFINNLEKRKISKKEMILVRDEIVDRLLDKNPLAIKIITSNILPTKEFSDLRDQLQTDFFNISEEDISLFDNASDVHIDRKKSLYGSILYSYGMLLDNEKKAFEKLSLFPDGINMETFKKLSRHSKDKDFNKNIISDKIIKKLQNKSLIEDNHGTIKLQSIIGRFAEKQFNLTEKNPDFFDSVFEYNCFITDSLTNLIKNKNVKRETFALKYFEENQNNTLKALSYLKEYTHSNIEKLDFIENSCSLFQGICSLANFIRVLGKNEDLFYDNELIAFKTTMAYSNYYNGQFQESYENLKELVPLSELKLLIKGNEVDMLIFSSSQNLYSMEGNQALIYDVLMSHKHFEFTKASIAYELGITEIKNEKLRGFPLFEFQYITNNLDLSGVDKYLEEIYEKAYLEKVQVSYVKAKLIPYNSEYINRLVAVNPYTSGLKQLMFAFCETDIEKANDYYQQAIRNLKHIKYYYVEAIYFYSKFLKKHELKEYDVIYETGYELTKNHYYRYLEYLFDELETPTDLEYNPQKYLLPDFNALEELVS